MQVGTGNRWPEITAIVLVPTALAVGSAARTATFGAWAIAEATVPAIGGGRALSPDIFLLSVGMTLIPAARNPAGFRISFRGGEFIKFSPIDPTYRPLIVDGGNIALGLSRGC